MAAYGDDFLVLDGIDALFSDEEKDIEVSVSVRSQSSRPAKKIYQSILFSLPGLLAHLPTSLFQPET